MKLMLHVMGKDLRRLRAWLAVWISVLLLKFGAGFYLVLWSRQESPGSLQRLFTQWSDVVWTLTALDVALTFLIAALLVHEDSVIGSNGFWMTKPLSGKRLLGAKALGALVLLGLPPLILSLPWWVLCGFRVPQMAFAAGETLVIQMALALLAMAMAALADTLARVVIWTVVGILTLGGGSVLWGALILADKSSVPTRFLAEAVVLTATLIAVIASRFLTRRGRLSFALLAGGIALEAGILGFWPWALIRPPATDEFRPEWHAERGAGVRLGLDSKWGILLDETRETLEKPLPGEAPVGLRIPLRAENVPTGLLLGVGALRHAWRWPDGTNVEEWSRGYTRIDFPWQLGVMRKTFSLPPPRPDQETVIWEEAARARGINGSTGIPARFDPTKDGVVFSTWVKTWKSVVARARQSPPAYRVTADLELVEPERLVDLPLTSSAWRADGGCGIRLAAVKRNTADRRGGLSTLELVVVKTEPDFLSEGVVNAVLDLAPPQLDADYLVINHPRGDILGTRTSQYEKSKIITLGGVALQSQRMTTGIPSVIRDGKWTSAQDWALGDGEIAIVGYREVARFQGTLDVPQFTIRN